MIKCIANVIELIPSIDEVCICILERKSRKLSMVLRWRN